LAACKAMHRHAASSQGHKAACSGIVAVESSMQVTGARGAFQAGAIADYYTFISMVSKIAGRLVVDGL